MTAFNTFKTIMGAGILGLPMIFAEASLIPSLVFLTIWAVFSSFRTKAQLNQTPTQQKTALSGIASGISFWFLGVLSQITEYKSWRDIWRYSFAPPNAEAWESYGRFQKWFREGSIVDIIIITENVLILMMYTMIASTNFAQVTEDLFGLEVPEVELVFSAICFEK